LYIGKVICKYDLLFSFLKNLIELVSDNILIPNTPFSKGEDDDDV